jgi:hypothetical protein
MTEPLVSPLDFPSWYGRNVGWEGLGMVATEFSVYHLSFSILFSFVIYDTGRT